MKGGMDVLVVDDDPAQLRTVSRQLGGRHRVRVAMSIAEARRCIEEREPDVVISDDAIGDGDGRELLEWIAVNRPQVRRILYAGSRPESWTALVERRMAEVALEKPATREALLAALAGPSSR